MALNSDDVVYIGASFACFMFLYKFVIPAAFGRFSKEYDSLPGVRRVCVDTSAMALLHSALVGSTAVYLFLFSDVITPYVIRREVPLLKLAVCILLGYTLADIVVLAANPTSEVSHWSMFLHHVICLYAGHASAAAAELPYYQLLWTLMELSNPFNNLREILRELGQKASTLYRVNGLVLLVAFFLTRVAPIPFFWYHLTPIIQSADFYEVTFSMKVTALVLSPMMHFLNCFWFYKICRGAIKYFFGMTNKKN